ncbi:relaxase MobL [Ruminococcus sp. TM463]|nr:relaxase MobL [Ruminococcus sp. TM463]MCB7526250.1 relaxase MobL [Ruminococcus sp. TM463]
MSTPAVVFSLGFTYDWAIGGFDFLEYMDRPEAFDKTRHLNDEYKDFIDYMSNSEKSDGLFNAQSDLLTESDKEKYRQLETVSRDAGCPKYYGVVSFDNNFLIENGLMTSDGKLDVHGIKELGREGINAMISTSNKLDNDNVYWTGAIHTNTDNIHIHFSICEYERREDRCKVYRDKDCIEVKAFDKLKSKIVNRVLGSDYSRQLTELERESIKPALSSGYGGCAEQLIRLADKLPSEGGWQYGRPKMRAYRDDIDKTVDAVIASDPQLSSLWKQYNDMLDSRTEYLRKIYGEGERHLYATFKPNRLEDFHKELGNQLLDDLAPLAEQLRASALPQAHPSENENSEQFLPPQYDEDTGIIMDMPEYSQPNSFDEEYYNSLYASMDAHPSENENGEQFLPPQYDEDTGIIMDMPEYSQPNSFDEEYYNSLYASMDAHPSENENGEQFLPPQYDEDTGIIMDMPEYSQPNSLDEEYYNSLYASMDAHPSENEMWFDEPPIPEADLYPYPQEFHLSEKETKSQLRIEWSDRYKQALDLMYGSRTADGKELPKDLPAALELLAQESDSGNVLATYDLGKLYHIMSDENYDLSPLSEQNYIEALDGFEKLSNKQLPSWQHSYICYRVGKMYDKGLGTVQDYKAAREYYEKAGENRFAYFSLGNMYKFGSGVEVDMTMAVSYYEKALACKGDMPFASYALGQAYELGQGVKADEQKAAQHYTQALTGFTAIYEKSHEDSISYRLGTMYLKGKGTDVDLAKAEKYLLESADNGNNQAQYQLGKLRLAQDRIDEAEQLFIKSAEKGNVYSAFSLGRIYMTEEKRDDSKAEQFLKQYLAGSDDELGIGEYALGKLYLSQDRIDEAEQLFIKSAEKGNAYSAFSLGRIYMTEEKRDDSKAEQFLKQYLTGSDDELGIGEYALGKLYLSQDRIDEAEQLFISSSEKENLYASYKLGKLYLTDRKLDYTKAVKYLKPCADKADNEYAQYALGCIYLKKEHYDRKLAEKYLLESSGHNNSSAQLKLALMYREEQKYRQSDYWMRLAAQNGNEYAQKILAERHEQIRMKLHLGATANSVMRRVCSNMQTKAQQLLAQVERDEQEQKYKQAISQTYSR